MLKLVTIFFWQSWYLVRMSLLSKISLDSLELVVVCFDKHELFYFPNNPDYSGFQHRPLSNDPIQKVWKLYQYVLFLVKNPIFLNKTLCLKLHYFNIQWSLSWKWFISSLRHSISYGCRIQKWRNICTYRMFLKHTSSIN